MAHRIPTLMLALAGLFAFCTKAESKSLDLVQNPSVRAYAEAELAAGAPSSPIASQLIYREALADLEAGRREDAEQKLQLAADLSGNGAAPLFTLARVEALRANPSFLPHLLEAIRRSFASFPDGAVLSLNLAALLALSLAGALLAVLAGLLVRYWPYIDHAIVERYGGRLSPAFARWILPLALVCLVLLRPGIAVCAAVLLAALWTYLNRHERIVVGSLAAVVAAASLAAPLSNRLAAAVDPYSVTRRLALVNERSTSADRLAAVRAIDAERYRAERAFAAGTMISRIGLYEEGTKLLLEAVEARPDFAPAFVNLGNVYFLRGDYDRALQGYRSAVEIDSTSAVAQYNIGQTYIKKMLFAQSGVWLQRANTLGFERYRASHPAMGMRGTAVYEQGFPAAELRRVAAAEGASRDRVILSEMLQPWLLLPFHRLWILLAAAVAAGVAIARASRVDRRKLRCDNCGRATCPRCSDTLHDARLCADCADIVRDLSSIKVMEALLRTRRQKVFAARSRGYRWRTIVFPGMGHACFGSTFTGFALAFAASASVAGLAWRGLYFKNPLEMNGGEPAWEIALPLLVLAAACAIGLRARPPQEERNYHLFPAEVRSRADAPASPRTDEGADLWLSPSSARPVSRKPVRVRREEERAAAPEATHPDHAAPAPGAPARSAPSQKAPAAKAPGPKPPAAEPAFPWESEAPPPPPSRVPPRVPRSGRETPAPSKGAAPARPAPQGKAAEMDDFLAEIKKGSSWH